MAGADLLRVDRFGHLARVGQCGVSDACRTAARNVCFFGFSGAPSGLVRLVTSVPIVFGEGHPARRICGRIWERPFTMWRSAGPATPIPRSPVLTRREAMATTAIPAQAAAPTSSPSLLRELWCRRLDTLISGIANKDTYYVQIANAAEHISAEYHGRFLIELLQNANDQAVRQGLKNTAVT